MASGVKYGNLELGEHLDALFQCQLLKITAAMAAWATAWQKTSLVQTRLGCLSPKTFLNLC
jgi:hypothetical protein